MKIFIGDRSDPNRNDKIDAAASQARTGSPGDRVFFEPGEEHWHGAAPNRFMTHLAMLEGDDEGNSATWGDHVTEEAYNVAPQP